MNFVWHEKKNQENKEKHGRFLSEAVKLWMTDNRIVPVRIVGNEQRFVISGFVDQGFWICPFCYQDADIRLISFYRKDEKERFKYGW